MKARISVITLGVRDLAESLAFYRDGLGFRTDGIIGTEFKGDETHAGGEAVMFELEGGLILALYGRRDLALDANEPLGATSTTEFSIGHLARSREEVDALMEQARAAGAIVTDEPYE